MREKVLIRTSFGMSPETSRQLERLCVIYDENKTKVMTRCIQMAYSSIKDKTTITKEDQQNESQHNI